MKVETKAIVIVEGGVVQNVYCPNPNIEFDYIVVDYDLEESGIEGMEDLIHALEQANTEEIKFDSEPTIQEILQQKQKELTKLKNL